MIGIFQGRGIAERARAHAQIDTSFRDYFYLFNNGRNLNALAIFLHIALYANEGGWAWPGRALIMDKTGMRTEAALTAALAHLREVRIDGQRIFSHYREIREDGRWGNSAYLIFPDLPCGDPPAHLQNLQEFDPRDDREEAEDADAGKPEERTGEALMEQYFGPKTQPDTPPPTREEPKAWYPSWSRQEKSATVPVQAGGADAAAAAVVDGICRYNHGYGMDALPEKECHNMVVKVAEILEKWGGATVEQAKLAWDAWTVKCAFNGRQANPFYASFPTEYGPLLVGVRKGTITAESLQAELNEGPKSTASTTTREPTGTPAAVRVYT